jgi:hypothetical protein
MAFSKSFPRTVKGSNYPIWAEIFLPEQEEREQEQLSRKENIILIKQCLEDAKSILKDSSLKDFQTNLISLAIALFDKRASHTVYWKENKAKEKFDKKFSV